MKEKGNILLEEESHGLFAAEPVGAVTYSLPYADRQALVVPNGVPQTVEAAVADIEEGEREFERGETFSHREVMQMIWGTIESYAG